MRVWRTKSGHEITRLVSGRSNVFLVSGEDKRAVIDTSSKRYRKKLNDRLRSLGIDRIDYLILTHAHYDHVGNAGRLKREFRPAVFIHQSEAEYLANGTNAGIRGTNPISGLAARCLAKPLAPLMEYEPCRPDHLIGSFFDLSPFGFHAHIMPTPGHTEGSISLIVDDEIAIVGDCMFGVFKSSAYPPFAQNPDELIKSWGKLLETPCDVFLPSHGREKTRGQILADYRKRAAGGRSHP